MGLSFSANKEDSHLSPDTFWQYSERLQQILLVLSLTDRPNKNDSDLVIRKS